MSLYEIFFIGFSLAMDAFAVSICKGLLNNKINFKKGVIIALYFGLFQGIMPFLGYLLGESFDRFIINIDHWISFVLLSLIGFNMIKDSFKEEMIKDDSISFFVMIPVAIATSIDALTIGITFAFLQVEIFKAIYIISSITFLICLIGYVLGVFFGGKCEKKSKIFGGIVLIFVGMKILFEHLGGL